MGFAGASSATAGAGAVRAAAVGAGAAPRDTLAGALRGGAATGVVAMTWISGSFVALELEASCAEAVFDAIASVADNAKGNARSAARMTDDLVRPAVFATPPMCRPLTTLRI